MPISAILRDFLSGSDLGLTADAHSGLSSVCMNNGFAYHDREADIAWLPTGESDRVVSEEVEWGLIGDDSKSDAVGAIEIWSANKRLPLDLLEALPAPAGTHGAAA